MGMPIDISTSEIDMRVEARKRGFATARARGGREHNRPHGTD
jgi:hypothetical protein